MSFKKLIGAMSLIASLIAPAAFANQFIVELSAPLRGDLTKLKANLKVSEVQRFEAPGRHFMVLEGKDIAAIEAFLFAKSVTPVQIHEVDFVNSPIVGGGDAAGETMKPGHQLYLIERPIPGVGDFPLEKKQKISKGSIAAMTKLGGKVEWEQSYLTDIGTFCLYRAEDENLIVEHGQLAGAPIKTITQVSHVPVID